MEPGDLQMPAPVSTAEPGPPLVLRGGRIIDPSTGQDAPADLTMANGTIVDPMATPEPPTDAPTTIDVSGCVVVPGAIDLHAHVMEGLGNFCLAPDAPGVDQGVPTVVDGGTSGWATFDIARRAVIDHPETRSRILAFIDPNALYLATKDFICHKLEIANDLRNLNADELAASLERNADVVVGLKVRVTHTGDPEVSPFLDAAKEATDLPIMVHLGRFPHTPVIPPRRLLEALRPGDIVTHAFRGYGGLVSSEGAVVPEFREAVQRGVILDVGHSGTDFRFREARRLFEQGYIPDTISTDLNIFNVGGPVFSLAETASKFLALGLDLTDVIPMITTNPAWAIQRSATLGSLEPGRGADATVFRVVDGPTRFNDGEEEVIGDQRLLPVGCVRNGHWIPTPELPTYATAGKTWVRSGGGSAYSEDEDW
ncbi:MAG: amidohydrolase/deacetylase family metallohydrolase [Actinomycetota bacterium]